MGSSGGGYFSSKPEDIKRMLNDSEDQTDDKDYQTTVDTLLSSHIANFNDRDQEAINKHLDVIKNAIQKDIDGTVDLLFGGSVGKHTYVDGLSDIDSLVILNNSELATKNPTEVKEYFADKLRERLPNTSITVGNLAVTLKFSDAEIQLLPAVKDGDKLRVPKPSGDDWSNIRPRSFSDKLTVTNQKCGGKIVPIIKLAKSAISNLPERHQITGYHAESIAVKVFKSYDGALTPREMLKHFFSEGSKVVNQPIRDSTGQSVHVDSYLGSANSLERKVVSDAFSRVYRRLSNADNSRSVEEWDKIFK